MIAADLQNVQVWGATTPVDMRKSFDSLAEVVRSFLGQDPLSGNLFVFRNKGGHLAKVLWWDRDGLAIYYKRLERGEFQFPRAGTPVIEISCEQLLRLLSGMRVSQSRRDASAGMNVSQARHA
jgi:transposase